MPFSPNDSSQKEAGDHSQAQLKVSAARSRWSWAEEMLTPLKARHFRLLFTGQMISTVGDTFYAVALPWLMLTTHHTPQELGIVLAVYGVPRVGTLLLGGILSDRLGPRRVMLLSDGMRALLVGLMGVFVTLDYVDIWRLGLVAAVLGIFTGLFLPAYYSIVPEILPNKALQAGNALNASTLQFALFLGSGIAGAVVSRLGSETALFVDAGTFAASALTLMLIDDSQPSFLSAKAEDEHQQAAFSQAETANEPRFMPGISFWQLIRTWRLLQVALLVVVFMLKRVRETGTWTSTQISSRAQRFAVLSPEGICMPACSSTERI